MYSASLTDIKNLLTAKLQATFANVIDESGQHAGHANSIPGKLTHIAVEVKSPLFKDKSLVEKHRLIYQALQSEMDQGLHAIKIISAN